MMSNIGPIKTKFRHWNRNYAPKSDRAPANEGTLIGAFGDALLAIERPMPFERNDFRYADAEGFSDQLS